MKKMIGTMILGLTASGSAVCMESQQLEKPINRTTDHSSARTPLHLAVDDNDHNMAQHLLNLRANVDDRCMDIAIHKRNIGMMKLLIEYNADLSQDQLNKKNLAGYTVLHIIAQTPHQKDNIDWLCSMGADLNAKTLKKLTQHEETPSGLLPLHAAVLSKDTDNVDAIVRAMEREQKKLAIENKKSDK